MMITGAFLHFPVVVISLIVVVLIPLSGAWQRADSS